MIPLKLMGKGFVKDFCKRGKSSEHCRYFSEDSDGPACLKLSFLKEEIDKEVNTFLGSVSYDCPDLPIGDNCSGCAPPLSILLN